MAEPAINVIWCRPGPPPPGRSWPVVMLERPLAHGDDPKGGLFNRTEVARVGNFWVPSRPVLGAGDPGWELTCQGQYVAVHVVAYRTIDRTLANVLTLGLSLGLAAMASLRQDTADPIQVLHLVLGHDVEDLAIAGVQALRCHVGLAVQT